MPRIIALGPKRLSLIALVVILALGFTPISHALLRSVHGSFAPTHYSSLALGDSTDATGVLAGEKLRIQLVNHSGHTKTYHWGASEKGSLLSLGAETVDNGQTLTFAVPTRGAVTGTLTIALTGTDVYVTVPVVKL
jgi:hypothetical protein